MDEGMKKISGTYEDTNEKSKAVTKETNVSSVTASTEKNTPKKNSRNEYMYTGPNLYMPSTQGPVQEKELIFCSEIVEEEEEELDLAKNNILYAAECVQILDQIPFEEDQLDEDEMEYYDSFFNA